MEMDSLDIAKCQKSRRRDIMGIMGKFNGKRQNSYSYHLLHLRSNRAVAGQKVQWLRRFLIFLEREHLLSRILADQTVGFRRSKKESCSMQ